VTDGQRDGHIARAYTRHIKAKHSPFENFFINYTVDNVIYESALRKSSGHKLDMYNYSK